MKITTYKTKLNKDKLNILVKESDITYESDTMYFTTSDKIVNMMNHAFDMVNLAEEYLYMIAFDTKIKVLGVFELSHGTVNNTLINPREIFIRAVLCGAVYIVLTHNHPSGEPTPSKADIEVTKQIKEVGKLIGINLLDHIIVGYNCHCSLKEYGII